MFELYEGEYGEVICLSEYGANIFDPSVMMMERVFMIDINGLWIYAVGDGYKVMGVDDV